MNDQCNIRNRDKITTIVRLLWGLDVREERSLLWLVKSQNNKITLNIQL